MKLNTDYMELADAIIIDWKLIKFRGSGSSEMEIELSRKANNEEVVSLNEYSYMIERGNVISVIGNETSIVNFETEKLNLIIQRYQQKLMEARLKTSV